MQFIAIVFSFLLLTACNNNTREVIDRPPVKEEPINAENTRAAYFASGCFWCVEAIYESVRGVHEAISGYAGGHTDNPTYKSIGTGTTGHAETVKVFYDPDIVDFETLVKVYYASQDPTTVNGQAPDFGTQYRSIIFYSNDEEKQIAERMKASLDASGTYDKPIATEIVPFKKFYIAEDYHQNFEKRNPNHPYVQRVSIPRLKRFQAKHPELLKSGIASK